MIDPLRWWRFISPLTINPTTFDPERTMHYDDAVAIFDKTDLMTIIQNKYVWEVDKTVDFITLHSSSIKDDETISLEPWN